MNLIASVTDTFQKHSKVWAVDSIRETAVTMLTNIGTNMLLSDVVDVMRADPMYIAKIIVLLENYAGEEKVHFTLYNPIVAKKLRDLNSSSSGRRDALKMLERVTSRGKEAYPKDGSMLPLYRETGTCISINL